MNTELVIRGCSEEGLLVYFLFLKEISFISFARLQFFKIIPYVFNKKSYNFS